MLISIDHASVLWVLFYKIFKALSVPLGFNYLAIFSSLYPFISSPLLSEEKGLQENGYKGRDTKQSIKRGMSKGGCCTKGKWEFLFMEEDNNIIFTISVYVVCTPFIV